MKQEDSENPALEGSTQAGNNVSQAPNRTAPNVTLNANPTNVSTEKPKAFTIKYKRPRGSRACVVCRSRKVRCDAEIHIPCTNCITFGCECTVPEAKKRGNASSSSDSSRVKRKQQTGINSTTGSENGQLSSHQHQSTPLGKSHSMPNGSHSQLNGGQNYNQMYNQSNHNSSNIPNKINTNSTINSHNHYNKSSTNTNDDQLPTNGGLSNEPVLNISQVSVPPSLTSNYKNRPSMHKKELLSGKGRASLTFLGSSSIGHVAQKVGQNHVELTEDLFDLNDTSLDSVELEILKLRGAFLLPSTELSLDLIESYFEHVHPLMPVINRTEFMKKFKDPNDLPSLMLLQAVLLCGSRVSSNPLLVDSKGSKNLASLTFYRRAKALYETNYESDPVLIIQTLILIGSYWEGPEDVTKNSFYWSRVAVGLAQGFGFQRDVSNSPNLSIVDKKIWRRIWWCLFEKDRNVAIAFGRPSVIDLNDCDVPMLTIDDFNEDEPNGPSPYEVNTTQALYFIHLVKLAEITGIIIKHQYTVKAELMKRKNKFPIIQHCDMLMGIWFTNLPSQLVFSLSDKSTQNFYSCLLNAQYYNRLYLIHRSNLLRMAKSNSTNPNNYKYPSWGISFQAARMISIVSKNLLDRDQIKYCPVMFVYILFSALMMLIYHVDSPNNVIALTASDSLFVSRAVLRELGKYWPIAGVLVKLFDKYANDKFKRAKIIENATKVDEYQEIEAIKKERDTHNNINSYYGTTATSTSSNVIPNNQVISSPSGHLTASGISPGGGVYHRELKLDSMDPSSIPKSDPQQNHQQDHTPQQGNGQSPQHIPEVRIEDLVQQFKQPVKKNGGAGGAGGSSNSTKSRGTNDTSPTSSTQSFPDISLVTENIPANSNFFENFEPTQLFPEVRSTSYPPSRSQSPTTIRSLLNDNNKLSPMETSGVFDDEDTSNVHQPPTTPGGGPTNFMDSSFINMNLQPSVNNYLNDDFGSLFNFQV